MFFVDRISILGSPQTPWNIPEYLGCSRNQFGEVTCVWDGERIQPKS